MQKIVIEVFVEWKPEIEKRKQRYFPNGSDQEVLRYLISLGRKEGKKKNIKQK